MSGYDLHQHEADEGFGRDLANREVSFYLANPVLDNQVCFKLEPFYLALFVATGSSLGSLQRSIIDEKLFLFCIDFFVALAFVRVAIVCVA